MTSKPRIIVTRKLPAPVEERIAGLFDASFNPSDDVLGADEIIARAQGADGILVEVHCNPSEALCDKDQAMSPEMFAGLMNKLGVLHSSMRQIYENMDPGVLERAA